jgi:hypothetical protein
MRRWLLLGASSVAWMVAVVLRPDIVAQARLDSRVVPALRGPAAQESGGDVHASASFATSDNCLACHNGLTAPSGEDVSIGVSWRASMMANASRDPYWQAGVRRETMDHPTRQAAIEDECAICHMPMARSAARAAGRRGRVFDVLPSAHGDSDEHRLAADGVSCTLCHQIGPERLGSRDSFDGGFAIGPAEGGGARMFGPFEVDSGRTALMRSATGVTPTKGDHLRESELCATCHTLYTTALGPDGNAVGSLPEQMPYLEWRHSAFAKERSCQSCHMPVVEGAPIASVLGEPRERLARHTFIGGNAFMLRMLNRFRRELQVTAPASELEASAQATLRQLQTDTSSVAITRAVIDAGRLEADVVVRNLTGHKLPTGYPSRRVWLHVTVRDAGGRTLFESGAVSADGRIAGNDNDEDGSRVEAHHEQIRSSEDVQIYESVMGRPDGHPTTGLLQATQFLKDNRLLPRGFDKSSAAADIAVRGEASRDPDFTAEGDRVRYLVPLTGVTAPVTVDVELRYQPIAFRWAEHLRGYDAPEPRRFVSYYQAMAPSSSTVLSRATATAGP